MALSDLLAILGAALVSFLVAWSTVRAEESKGRAAFYSLCCRYFISAFNSIDHTSNTLKQDVLSKNMYIAELAAIVSELSALSTNPFFSRFIARNEFAPQMLVQLRRELTEHISTPLLAMNQGSIGYMLRTYAWCKKLPWGFWLARHDATNQLASFFQDWVAATNNSFKADGSAAA